MRWVLVVVFAGVAILAVIGVSPALHGPGADCPALEENSGEPEHGTPESYLSAGTDGTTTGCPVDDGAEMTGPQAAPPPS